MISEFRVADHILDYLDGRSPIVRLGFLVFSENVILKSGKREVKCKTKTLRYLTYSELCEDSINWDGGISKHISEGDTSVSDNSTFTLVYFKEEDE